MRIVVITFVVMGAVTLLMGFTLLDARRLVQGEGGKEAIEFRTPGAGAGKTEPGGDPAWWTLYAGEASIKRRLEMLRLAAAGRGERARLRLGEAAQRAATAEERGVAERLLRELPAERK